jgi:hypothetical protein
MIGRFIQMIKTIVLKTIVSYEPKPSSFPFDIDNLLTSNCLKNFTPPNSSIQMRKILTSYFYTSLV